MFKQLMSLELPRQGEKKTYYRTTSKFTAKSSHAFHCLKRCYRQLLPPTYFAARGFAQTTTDIVPKIRDELEILATRNPNLPAHNFIKVLIIKKKKIGEIHQLQLLPQHQHQHLLLHQHHTYLGGQL